MPIHHSSGYGFLEQGAEQKLNAKWDRGLWLAKRALIIAATIVVVWAYFAFG